MGSRRGCVIAYIEPGLVLPQGPGRTLGVGVRLCPVPAWARRAGMFEGRLDPHQATALRSSCFCFRADFTFAEGSRPGTVDLPSPEESRAESLIRDAALALWLSQRCYLSVKMAVRWVELEDGKLHWNSGFTPDMTLQRGFGSGGQSGEYFSSTTLDDARRIAVALSKSNGGALGLAKNALWYSLTVTREEVSFLLLWVALKSLFSPETPDQLTAKLTRWLHGFATKDLKRTGLSKSAVSRWYTAKVQDRSRTLSKTVIERSREGPSRRSPRL